MSQITLNIGLFPSGQINKLPNAFGRAVASAAVLLKAADIRAEERQSQSEPTAIIELTSTLESARIESAITNLCNLLQQDAVALIIDGKGALYGPKAADWGGKFIPGYFLLPSWVGADPDLDFPPVPLIEEHADCNKPLIEERAD